MRKEWNQAVITKVTLAIYVRAGTGKPTHRDRPFHGFVLNDENVEKDYIFSDGQVLHTDGCSLFYLPKGSSYSVKDQQAGGCYAINFDTDISDVPFQIRLKNPDRMRKHFRLAAEHWRARSELAQTCAMVALYDVLLQISQERSEYVTRQTQDKLQPAMQLLEDRATDPELTVAALAQACGVSQVYFRKIFHSRFGVGPKEYLTQKRLEYAQQLLQSGQFSVSEVGRLCGYTEPCHFSREFSARIGSPPNRYGK